MTLDELLSSYKTEYSDTWYLEVLDRFLHLYTLSDWDHLTLCALPASSAGETDEYSLLKQWVEDVVEKGVRVEEGQ